MCGGKIFSTQLKNDKSVLVLVVVRNIKKKNIVEEHTTIIGRPCLRALCFILENRMLLLLLLFLECTKKETHLNKTD